MDEIVIKGARENNLKNVDITLEKNKLITMTGVSGSGKSSLAFDTLYKEGERRYVESLSSYARQFLGDMKKPDVDKIEGLSPAISIDQKTTSHNPRSTVGTSTEIYDYLRLLYARVGKVYCPTHNNLIKKMSIEEMTESVLKLDEGSKLIIKSPLVENEKGDFQGLFNKLIKDGFIRVEVDQEVLELTPNLVLDEKKSHDIAVIIDRIVLKEGIRSRLFEALEQGTTLSGGKVIVEEVKKKNHFYNEHFNCPDCDFTLTELEPRIFSFNSPVGACQKCKGLGNIKRIDEELIIKDEKKSIKDGTIIVYNNDPESIDYQKLECVAKHFKIDLTKPYEMLTKKEKEIILYGSNELINFDYTSRSGLKTRRKDFFEGIIPNLERRFMTTSSRWVREWLQKYMLEDLCDKCMGARLNDNSLAVKVGAKNIHELSSKSVSDILKFLEKLKLNKEDEKIASLILEELNHRLSFLEEVGLGYITLARGASTLSGGENQRIRLASQIGSHLTGVLYVLDEPSIGLHPRDNQKLIDALKKMRDLGNTLVVVEHDPDMMLQSDYLVDVGPKAGDEGGEIVAYGTPEEVMKNENSLTGKYLSHKIEISVPEKRRKQTKRKISIKKASENNLKNIDVNFPLSNFIVVTGVSGSGKSSLVMEILRNAARRKIYNSKVKVGQCGKIEGLDEIDKVVDITQEPIGRTPRSNPATYTGVFDDIRELFTKTSDAERMGYKKNRFSFNVKGGRCEACRGDGVKRISMNFLPDVEVTCEVCKGKRYNTETLKIKYREKTIADVLDMRVVDALKFFENHPKIREQLEVLERVGLGYIRLGQSATTLSGGEASRVKLASELKKKRTGKTLFILDEPTTGLHFDDVRRLLEIIQEIVDNKDTVIVIEHNLDIIKQADYIIDLGPEGGDAGGNLVYEGPLDDILNAKESYTGKFLKEYLSREWCKYG